MNISGAIRTAVGLAALVTLTVGGLIAIEGVFRGQTKDIISRHHLHLANRQFEWDKEAAQRAIEERRADAQRLLERHEEMILAFGGPIAAAAKNPDSDISAMLREVCALCTGNKSATQVTVERFTEFNLAVDMDLLPAGKSPEDIIRCALRHCSGYVSRFRFHRRGFIVAELDRRAIESVADWETVSGDGVRQLLAEMDEVRGEAATPAAVSLPPSGRNEEEGNLTHRSQLLKQALGRFSGVMSNSVRAIDRAVRLQADALEFENARSSKEITTARSQLAESAQILENARTFFSNPAAFYRQTMVEVGLDRLFIDTELRSQRLLDTVNAPLTLEIIAKVEKRGQSAGELLQVMGDALGAWNYDPLTRRFQFDDPQTAAAYRATADKLAQDAVDLGGAFARWSRISK